MTKKTITIGFVAMIIVNIVLITLLIWQSKDHHSRHRHPSEMLVRQLDFTEDQIKQFDELRSVHFSVVRPKLENIGALKRKLMNTSDTAEARQLTKEIGVLEGQIDFHTFEHFSKISQMCSPVQKEKMNEINKRMSERMSKMHQGDGRDRYKPH